MTVTECIGLLSRCRAGVGPGPARLEEMRVKPVRSPGTLPCRPRGIGAGSAFRKRCAMRLLGGLPAGLAEGIRDLAGFGPHRRLPFVLAYRLNGRHRVPHPPPAKPTPRPR